MGNRIHTLYVVHHSHTDIGYTDLQENVLDLQTDNIRDVIRLLRSPENREFRWNCETLFIVERFLEEADEEERKEFFACVRRGNIGISLNYLNFNDLLHCGRCLPGTVSICRRVLCARISTVCPWDIGRHSWTAGPVSFI